MPFGEEVSPEEEKEQLISDNEKRVFADEKRYRPKWLRWFVGTVPLLTARQWRVLSLLSLAGFFSNYDTVLFGVAIQQVQDTFHVDDGSIGT